MKKYLILLISLLFTTNILAQYEKLDSLPLERIYIHFNNEYNGESAISLGDGDYLVNIPHKDRMLILTNSNRTKAIVIYNSYCFGRHLEFNIEENIKRLILWYKDKHTYCGYIYDKEFKVCKYFESRKQFKRYGRKIILPRR